MRTSLESQKGCVILSILKILQGWFKSDTVSKQELDSSSIEETENRFAYANADSISPDERPFYREDSYYTIYSYPETTMGSRVITFEERKKTTFPSKHGLYIAEILLLEYCKKGDYPKPKYGYPGFWWFSYGIRDVGNALKSLAQRGFIQLVSIRNSVDCLTVAEMKQLLKDAGKPVSGKKTDLIDRVKEFVSEEALLSMGVVQKYRLTDLGKAELEENAYVPYMHRAQDTTLDMNPKEPGFNIWRINRELANRNTSNWMDLVNEIRMTNQRKNEEQQRAYMEELKKIAPKRYKALKEQNEQIALINEKESLYEKDKNIGALIEFWERLWENGGLKVEGTYWYFRLVDLYIKTKQYDDALDFCKKILIKDNKLYYLDKANYYIQKINTLKKKSRGKSQI